MLTALFGAWTIMELIFLVPFILILGWTTHLDRLGRGAPKWWILSVFFIGYCIVYATSAPAGDWFPPVFHKAFWIDPATWWSLSKYLVGGICYAVFEMLVAIIEEKGEIRARWNLELEANAELKSYMQGTIGDEQSTYSSQVSRFSRNWNDRNHIVKLKTHALERTPQPTINFDLITENVFPWIALWPGYLVSMFFGRILDRIVNVINTVFRAIGNAVVRTLFRNTFSAN